MTVTIQKELLNGSKVTILPKKEQSLTLARRVAAEKKAEGCDEAFYVANLDNIIDRFNLWKKELPMFEPFYAVKCNPDPVFVKCLASLGVGFDCASKQEIDLVTKMGVRPEKVIYANPCKSTNFLLHAKKLEISLMTFDNAEELEKIAEHYEKAELIIRIGVADLTANCQLSVKFGCDPELEAPDLLRRAAELGLNVAGVSFHVGSGCNDPTAFRTALKHTKRLFGLGASLGFNMKMIDVGGGFPGSDHHLSFEKIAEVLRNGVEEYFGDSEVRLIAEPGRFFAAAVFSLTVNVMHAKAVKASQITNNEADSISTGYSYYVNDGIFGSFNCKIFDHIDPIGEPLHETTGPEFPTTIWGPTCDSIDKIETRKLMPRLKNGDWIYYDTMGAYTASAASTFNGFSKPPTFHFMSQKMLESLQNSRHLSNLG